MQKKTKDILIIIAITVVVSAIIYGGYLASKRWKIVSGNPEKDERRIKIVRNPNY